MFREGRLFVALKIDSVVPKMARTMRLQPKLTNRRKTLANRTRSLIFYWKCELRVSLISGIVATYHILCVLLVCLLFMLLHVELFFKRRTQWVQCTSWRPRYLERTLERRRWRLMVRSILRRITGVHIAKPEIRYIRRRRFLLGAWIRKRRLAGSVGFDGRLD